MQSIGGPQFVRQLRKSPQRWRVLGVASLAVLAAGCGKGIFSGNSSSSGGGGGGGGTVRSVYVTNFADGKLSSLAQSSATLTAPRSIASGKAGGPLGLAANVSASAIYVANAADNKIHEFSLDTNGNLKSLATAAAGDAPQQVAITTSAAFAYSINHVGSITQYNINSTTGALTRNSTTSGLISPVSGVATDSFLYVTDPQSGAGIVATYIINGDGTLSLSADAPSQGISGGPSNPGQITIDPTGIWVFVADATNGVVSVFEVQGNGLTFISATAATGAAAAGLAYATTASGNFLYLANPALNTVSTFSFSTITGILSPVTSTTGLAAPTGVTVDNPSSTGLLFVTNQSSGTVSGFSVDATTGIPTFVSSQSTENPANNSSSPEFIVVTG